MRPSKFLLLFSTMLALDGIITMLIVTYSDTGFLTACLVAAGVSYAALATLLIKTYQRGQISLLSILLVALISLGVSLALFGLILLRNPSIHWPVAFIAASMAGLAFAAFGYVRAAKAIVPKAGR